MGLGDDPGVWNRRRDTGFKHLLLSRSDRGVCIFLLRHDAIRRKWQRQRDVGPGISNLPLTTIDKKDMSENSFGKDVEFLNSHVETIVLSNNEGAQIAIVPAYQGRTMTSTSRGTDGTSYGYINYDVIKSDQHDPQINLYGGEDRMWISPEGGQYSVFFDPNAEMKYENWRTPPSLDSEGFDLVTQNENSVALTQKASIKNWSDYTFDIQMDREVVLLDKQTASEHLNVSEDSLEGLSLIAHESRNTLTNLGSKKWQPETGLIGIWMLCMNKPAPGATLIVPFKRGPVEKLGPFVNADYFGKLDQSRLKVDEKSSLIYFLGDGNMRSKLGLTFSRAEPYLGSWDKDRGVLSVVQFNLPESAPNGYNNNLWELQDNPYDGDVINGYNDGPNETGGQLGGFFELETISPALSLSPSENYTHLHRTIRMEGDRTKLSAVAQAVFSVTLEEIESKFGS